MIKVEVTTNIDAPVEEVFAFSTNNENDPTWMEEIKKVEKTSERPLGVGSTFINYVEFMGRTFDDSHEVTEYEPNKKMTIVQKTGPVPFKATYLFQPTDGGTLFSLHIEAETKGFFKVASPLVRRQLKAQYERNLSNLRTLLEAKEA